MSKAQYDVGHYALYFAIVLFVIVFLFSYITKLYGEKQVDVFRTSLTLEETFTVETVLRCFSDSHGNFDVTHFTDEVLQACDTRPVQAMFEKMDHSYQETLGPDDLKPEVVHKEYVALEQGGGVLTIVMEHA